MQLDELIDMLCQPQQDKKIKVVVEGHLHDFLVQVEGPEVRIIPLLTDIL